MSAVAVITLDTTAPTVEFGDALLTYSDRLIISYEVPDNDLYMIGATLVTDDGDFEMTVLPETIEIQLPPGRTFTSAVVRVDVMDDVFNETVHEESIFLTGRVANPSFHLEMTPHLSIEVDLDPHLIARMEQMPELKTNVEQDPRLNAIVVNDPDITTKTED